MHHARLLAAALVFASGCFRVQEPVRTSLFEGPDRDTLVVLLPGFGASDRTFEKKDVVAALRDAGVQADLLSVNAHYGYYVRDQLETRLREDVMPRAQAYEHVWVVGISMGGLGALLTAKDFPEVVDGVVLLSPFLGRAPTLRSVMAAPHLADWQAPAEPAWDEDLWSWLTALDGRADALPPVLLGYGHRDLAVDRLAFLAGHLPPERVRVVEGGHTWATWRALVDALGREELPKHPGFGPATD